MKNVAELKRLPVGTKIKMIYCKWENKLVGVERYISIRQTNQIAMSDGTNQSWLPYPTAKEFKGTKNGFIILDENGKTFMEYEILN